MSCRLRHLVAILTVCATVLAGMPFLASATAREADRGPCLCPAPFDSDAAVESLGPGGEAEREEKEAEEDGPGTFHLFNVSFAAVLPPAACHGTLLDVGRTPPRPSHGKAILIRGPPSR